MATELNNHIPCWVYRSGKKNEMYLYLDKKDGFDQVPEVLRNLFGKPILVMELELHAKRHLAREDVLQVMGNLRSQGYHLQMPPSPKPQIMHS